MNINLRRVAVGITLIVLAASTWWLTRLTSEPEPEFDGKLRHDPDFVVQQFYSVVMTEAGKPQYELRGERWAHYGDDGTSVIDLPYLIQHTPGRAPTHVRAREGFVPQNPTFIRLTGNVNLAQGRDPKGAGGEVRAQELTLKLDRSR